MGAGIAQGANILQKVEVVRQCFVLETLAAEFREVVKAAKGNDFLKGPDGETKIRKGCDKISGIRAIFATLDFLLQSIGRFAVSSEAVEELYQWPRRRDNVAIISRLPR